MLNIKTLLLKCTKKCNASCNHCAALTNKQKNLSLDEAKIVIDKVSKYIKNGSCNLIFHGGEPELLGVEYYKTLIEYIENKYPKKFSYSMQTNLLFYNKEWFKLIKKYNIGISTSYDFFSDLRNLGGNTEKYWNLWYKNVKQFQKDMSDYYGSDYYPYIINIVTKENYSKYKEIYEIAKKEKFQIRYNYFYKVGRGDKNSEKYYVEPEIYAKFLENIFNLWLEDVKLNKININKFVSYPHYYFIQKLMIESPYSKYNLCPWTNNCTGTFINVEPNGDIYNCSEMADIKLLKLGNIFEMTDLSEILKTENYKKLYNRRIDLPNECITCKYFKYCKGGCMRESYINEENYGNLYGKTWACKAWKILFQKIEENKVFLNNIIKNI